MRDQFAAHAGSETPAVPYKIEAVTVCAGYADILAHTLPHNHRQFDRMVVVTEPEDKQTRKVCETYGVQCVLTDAIATRWGKFCKGFGINAGLNAIEKDAWILHMDSDIVLPPNFREVLMRAQLDETMIYGCDRAEFKSFADWQQFYQSPEPNVQGNGFFLHITNHGQQLGTRVAFQHFGGYVPIGFFQLWHAASGILRYPEGHTDAGKEDSVFPTHWPRRKRGFIPEIVVYHLESELAPMGVNWAGRRSRKFGMTNEVR